MTEKISIVMATRNRPESLRRYYASLKETAEVMPEVCLYIDNDDVVSVPVAEECGFKYKQGPRKFLMYSMNEAFELATGTVFHYTGDDCPFRQKGWDRIVLGEFDKVSDKILLVYGDDDIGTNCWCAGHGFIHKNWTDTVGYFLPPYRFADQWLTEVAQKLGRLVHLPILISEHMHWQAGKAQRDQTYLESEVRPGNPPIPDKVVVEDVGHVVERLRRRMA